MRVMNTPIKPIDFIIIGAMKCGTTSLFDYLIKNPAVSGPPQKELRFFQNDEIYAQGLDTYHANWPASALAAGLIRGEASPQYSLPPEQSLVIAERIFKYNPDVKLVYLVRHPMERILSHWRHGHRGNPAEWTSFEKSVRDPVWGPWMIQRTRYLSILGSFWKFFTQERIKIAFLEDITSNTVVECAAIEAFLGIPTRARPDAFPLKNTTPQRGRPIDQKIIDDILDYLTPEMHAFLAHCGKPRDFWNLEKGLPYTI